MTEKELHLLGFDKEFIDEYEGDETYYYFYEIASGLSLISCSSEDVEDHMWYVDVFNTEPSIRFTEFGHLQGLINLLTSAIVK
jgi:hypothetical protein